MDRVTAVYNGKALVLQQAVDWPEGTVVEVKPYGVPGGSFEGMTPDEAWEWLVRHPRQGGGIEFDRGDLYP